MSDTQASQENSENKLTAISQEYGVLREETHNMFKK